jgi:hypothetical protein
MESASEQPAERLGSSTRLAGFSTLADSAMKWTPQKTMVDCEAFWASMASWSESPTTSASPWISGSW